MITKQKRTIFIEASSGQDFDKKINEALKGLPNPEIQIYGKYKGVIIYTEYTCEEDQAEKCTAKCGECPFYRPSTDGRVKWIICDKANRRVSANTDVCSLYPDERRDEIVPEIRTEVKGEKVGHGRLGFMLEDRMVESVSTEKGRYSVFPA